MTALFEMLLTSWVFYGWVAPGFSYSTFLITLIVGSRSLCKISEPAMIVSSVFGLIMACGTSTMAYTAGGFVQSLILAVP